MLTRTYQTHLRQAKLRKVRALIVATGTMAGLYAWMVHADGPVVFGSLCFAFTFFVAAFVLLPGLFEKPAPTYPIFDRRVVREPRSGSQARDGRTLKLALTRFGAELDELARNLGVEPLSRFMDFGYDSTITRHEPAHGVATLDALLKGFSQHASSFVEPDAVREALEELRADLKAAEASGARFCLKPVRAWTGLAETNLNLFLGAIVSRQGSVHPR